MADLAPAHAAVDTAAEERLAVLQAIEKRCCGCRLDDPPRQPHADRRDGLKVGGHQASSASVATLMTALYFHVLRPEDRVAVKPHASPVFHAIQYLLGHQPLDKLQNFRAFGGAQSYPSRTKDKADVDFSTGSVGLGVARPCSPSWCRTTCTPRAGARRPAGRAAWSPSWATPSSTRATSTRRCSKTGSTTSANFWWIIDYNRQSLDRVVPTGCS